MPENSELDAERFELLKQMRENFFRGDYDLTLGNFEQLGEIRAVRSGIRVEAISLAARALTAKGSKNEARQLLKLVWSGPLKNHRLCRHVAMACLDLGEYRHAATLSERAAELVESAVEVKSAG